MPNILSKLEKLNVSPEILLIKEHGLIHPRGEKLFHIRKKGVKEIQGVYCKSNSWGYQLYRFCGETDKCKLPYEIIID